MRFLVRLATKSAWPGGEPSRERAIADFQLRDGERGLSVWEYTDEAELNLALAAMACERIEHGGKIDKLDFITISSERVERIGIVTQTPGETPLPRANNELHRELQWTSDALERLATGLFDEQHSVTRMSKSHVRKLLVDLDEDAVNSATVQATLAAERDRETQRK